MGVGCGGVGVGCGVGVGVGVGVGLEQGESIVPTTNVPLSHSGHVVNPVEHPVPLGLAAPHEITLNGAVVSVQPCVSQPAVPIVQVCLHCTVEFDTVTQADWATLLDVKIKERKAQIGTHSTIFKSLFCSFM